jgi:biopolymer transport protein ExbB/TolQ
MTILNQKFISLGIGILGGLMFWLIILFLNKMIGAPGTTLERILMLFGSSIPSGIIQLLMYILFIFGISEILIINHKLIQERKSFDSELLPESDQFVLSPADVNHIKLKAIELNKKKSTLVNRLIIEACTKYRSAKSTSETLEFVGTWVRINFQETDAQQSLIRYCAWAIPSIGFIGTIIGIASSLGYASNVSGPEGISMVTGALNIAFDTTLIALILSLVLMLFYHVLTEKVDNFFTSLEKHVMTNLINRIYKS